MKPIIIIIIIIIIIMFLVIIITSCQPVWCTGFFKKKKKLQLSFVALNQNVSRLTNQIIQLNGEDPSIT